MLDDTVILFCSDHGDMLGERGLWFKMCFYDGSVRVPLMIAARGIEACRIDAPASNLDILPTLCELAGIELGGIAPWTDGQSLLPVLAGSERSAPVLMEYAAEGSYAPMVAIRRGRYKFVHCEIDPPQLFDLESDPLELTNLAVDPATGPAAWRISWPGSRALGSGGVRCSRAREPGAPLGGLSDAAQRRYTRGNSSRSRRLPNATCATTWI